MVTIYAGGTPLTVDVDRDAMTLVPGGAVWRVGRDEEAAAMELADCILGWLGVRNVR